MRVSLTGTRAGWTRSQRLWFEAIVERLGPGTSFAHGNCRGFDVQAHRKIRELLGRSATILVFPSTHPTSAAPIPEDADLVALPDNPLRRNWAIVRAGPDRLVACPRLNVEEIRSGTWHAIRFAQGRGTPVEKVFKHPEEDPEAWRDSLG